MERIKQYYRLCLIKSEGDKPTPLYNQLEEKVVVSVMGPTVVLFLKPDKKGYSLKENVIGGRESKKNNYPSNDEPILII